MYLNFTHIDIMNRLDAFYSKRYGIMERLSGDIYVSKGPPDLLELERYILHNIYNHIFGFFIEIYLQPTVRRSGNATINT